MAISDLCECLHLLVVVVLVAGPATGIAMANVAKANRAAEIFNTKVNCMMELKRCYQEGRVMFNADGDLAFYLMIF